MEQRLQNSRIWSSLRLALALGVSAIVLTGCTLQIIAEPQSQTQATTGPSESPLDDADSAVASVSDRDFKDYETSLEPLLQTEADLISRYDSVTGDNYTSDAAMFEEFITLVPDIQAFITQLESITPKSPELESTHSLLIKAWNLQAKGVTLAIDGIQRQDFGILAEANEALADGRSTIREFTTQLSSLRDEYSY